MTLMLEAVVNMACAQGYDLKITELFQGGCTAIVKRYVEWR